MKTVTLIPIYKKIKEKDFPEYIKNNLNYNCVKFINKNFKLIKNIILKTKLIEDDIIEENDYHLNMLFKYTQKGKPDFFIWNNKDFFFCEFKTENDSISHDQFNWYISHADYPIALAFVTDESDTKNLFNWLNVKQIKAITILHKLEEKATNLYVKENPKILNTHLCKHTDKYGTYYLGQIPKELSLIYTKIKNALNL